VKKLVFVHGMGHGGYDRNRLKQSWITALEDGLERAGKALPPHTTIELPHYGDELAELVKQIESGLGDDLTKRDPGGVNTVELELAQTQRAIMEELLAAAGVEPDEINRERSGLTTKDPQNWPIVVAGARILGRIPGMDTLIIDNFMKEVSFYLTYPSIRERVDEIVASAIGQDDVVVVGHSLGSVVSYNVLRARSGQASGSAFFTLGSPLGLNGVRSKLSKPLESPEGVDAWLNAFDPADIVALYPLKGKRFDVLPPVENYDGVKNFTKNRHGIKGYLSNRFVAERIVDAL
jgi:hypothetical protein